MVIPDATPYWISLSCGKLAEGINQAGLIVFIHVWVLYTIKFTCINHGMHIHLTAVEYSYDMNIQQGLTISLCCYLHFADKGMYQMFMIRHFCVEIQWDICDDALTLYMLNFWEDA